MRLLQLLLERLQPGAPMTEYERFSVRRDFWLLIPVLCLFSFTYSASAAQNHDQSPQTSQAVVAQTPARSTSLLVNANLVVVDVAVTNHGTPISGLPEGRFQIAEDGIPQKVTVFEEHKPEDSPLVSKAPPLGPNIYSDFPEFAITSATNVLLLDALNTPLTDQLYVRQQMIRYLENIPPGTRIAIFTLASRLRMVEGFTTDSSAIAKALSGTGGPQQSVVLGGSGDSQFASDSDISGPAPVERAASSLQQFEADLASFQTDLRVQMTLDSLKNLARYLNSIPGKKNLIWFSGSFPLGIDPLDSSFQAMRNYSDDLRQTATLLAVARVAVYPVDARGLMSLPSTSAASRFYSPSSGPPMPGKNSQRSLRGSGAPALSTKTAGPGPSAADQKFLKQTAVERATMQQIAEDTGGEAFLDTNGLKEAVSQAIANGARYYTLGYIPQSPRSDGSFHRLAVKVDGNYQLRYRRGYYVNDSGSMMAASQTPSLMRAALQLGAPQLSEIAFKVRVITASDPAAKGIAISPDSAGIESNHLQGTKVRYLIDYAVDSHSLAFTVTPDGVRHARVEFVAVAYDPDGKLLNHVDQGVGFKLSPEFYDQIGRSGLPMHQEIDIPCGHVFLRIAVHDMDRNRVGSTEVPMNVTK
jgi:VWFA-related protein